MNKKFKVITVVVGLAVIAAGCSKETTNKDADKKVETSATPGSEATNGSASDASPTPTPTLSPDEQKAREQMKKILTDDISKLVTLGDYKGVEVTKADTTVTDEEVEEQIESTLKSNATKEDVKDRKVVEKGDFVTMNYTGYKDGKAFDGGTAEGAELEIGSGSYIPGFEDNVIGKTIDKEFEFEITFPDDYNNEDLKGQKATFKVTVTKIQTQTVPKLDDTFVKSVSTTSKTVDEYKKEVRKQLEEQKEASADEKLKSDVWATVVENSKASEYPEDYVEYYETALKSQYEQMAQMYGSTMEEFLKSQGMTEDTFNTQVTESAKKSVLSLMTYQKLVQELDIKLDEDEYKKQIDQYVTQYGVKDEKELIEQNGEELALSVKNNIMLDDLIEKLVSMAKLKQK